MTAEEFFAELRGSMEVVVETCALIVARHPDKGILLAQLSALADHSKLKPGNDSEAEKHYKFGALRSLATIVDRVGKLEAQIEGGAISPEHRH